MGKTDKIRNLVIDLIDQEPELPQAIPDSLVETLRVFCKYDQKEKIAELFRICVRTAKMGIKERVNKSFDILEKRSSLK